MYQFIKAVFLTTLIVIPIASDNISSFLYSVEFITLIGVGVLLLVVAFMKAIPGIVKSKQSKKLQTNKAK